MKMLTLKMKPSKTGLSAAWIFFTRILHVIIVMSTVIDGASSITWLGLNRYKLELKKDNVTKIPSRSNLTYYGLSKRQYKLVRSDPGLFRVIHSASTAVLHTCELAFNQSRWDCSSLGKLPEIVSPELTIGTREQAFVYALASSILVTNIARGCSTGQIKQCRCAKTVREVPSNHADLSPSDYVWSDCSVNMRYGIKLAERFTDTHLRKYEDKNLDKIANPELRLKTSLAQLNLHNSRIGRQIVSKSLTTNCKCHGFSGSCTVRTCWQDLDHRKLLIELENQYRGAQWNSDSLLSSNPNVKANQPDKRALYDEKLVYNSGSSDYCNPDPSHGSHGTQGRICGDDYNNNCDWMCCGRGHSVRRYTRAERCNCEHVWCCYVKCDVCNTLVSEYVCN